MSAYRDPGPTPVSAAREPETVEAMLMEFGSKMAREGHRIRGLSVSLATMAQLRAELGDRACFQAGRRGEATIIIHTSAGSITIDSEQP